MSSLTTAEAWALASKVALIDARHCGPQESAALRDEALELMVRARTLDPDPCLLIDAQKYLDGKVQPAAHYDREMTDAERNRVFDLRAAMKRKPSRRRGLTPGGFEREPMSHMEAAALQDAESRRRGTAPAKSAATDERCSQRNQGALNMDRKIAGYCTKYALTKGIFPLTVEVDGEAPEYGYARGRFYLQVVIDRDFFVSREEAETAAKEMARRKHRSLLAQAAKVLRLAETPKHSENP